MKVYIYSIDKILYEGDSDVVTVPSETGELSILPEHAPIVTALKKGTVTIKNGDQSQSFPIESGFAQINQQQTILLVK